MQMRIKFAAAWSVAVLMLATALPTHAHAAFAEAQKSSGSYLVVEVPNHVIDDLVAVQRGTSRSSSDFPKPELDLTYKLCGTYECLCIDVDPEDCVPDSDHVRHDRILVASSVRTPAVVELVVRELKSGAYSAMKLCSTFQSLHVGCVTASPRRA